MTDEAERDPAAMGPFWAVYFWVVLVSATVQVASILALLLVWAGACRRCLLRRGKELSRLPGSGMAATSTCIPEHVAVVVACYLPNEAAIIEATLQHLLEKIVGVDHLDVHLVYNTPHEVPPLEEALVAMANGPLPKGRRLFVQRVHDSKSKAENLNHVIPKICAEETPFIAIYDADHHPDPDSLALAVSYMKQSGVDCVQGSTYVREGFCLFKNLVCAEFFVTYFVMLPIMQAISGTGFFGGANAVWAVSSLQRLQFDDQVLTEDIDCFARAVVHHGLTFAFLPESCSGELLPANLQAFWKQRLRWAMGWDQVTTRHVPAFWEADLPLRKRIGLYYIFVFRWFSQLCAVIVVLVGTTSSMHALLCGGPVVFQQAPPCVLLLQHGSFFLYLALISCVFLRAIWHKPCHAGLLMGLLMYLAAMPFYVLFGSVLHMVSLARLVSGRTGEWVVTKRSEVPKPREQGADPLAPLLMKEPPRTVWFWSLVTVGCLAQGASLGAVVGYLLGQREVVHPLWGWVPFGWGATSTYVTDGRVVAKGVMWGVGLSALVLLLLRWSWTSRRRHSPGEEQALDDGEPYYLAPPAYTCPIRGAAGESAVGQRAIDQGCSE